MNYKKHDHYIVVDEGYRPMAFQSNQFCYCQLGKARSPWKVQVYSYKEAKDLIKQTIKFRKTNNFSIGEYNLMPIIIKK